MPKLEVAADSVYNVCNYIQYVHSWRLHHRSLQASIHNQHPWSLLHCIVMQLSSVVLSLYHLPPCMYLFLETLHCLQRMVEGLSQLEHLDLSESEVLYMSVALGHSFITTPRMSYVNVMCFSFQQISDTSVRQAAFHCPLLVSVNLSGCPQVSSNMSLWDHL